jgi:hypothetical protein
MPVNIGAVRVPQNGGRVLVSAAGNAGGFTLDSGLQMLDAMGYSTFEFQLLGTFTGMSVTVYGTYDPLAYTYSNQPEFARIFGYNTPYVPWQGLVGVIPSTSWFPLIAPSDQSGAGYSSNPLTAAGQILECKQKPLAVRAVVTAAAFSTGQCSVIGSAWA